jgi:hypothetical protein
LRAVRQTWRECRRSTPPAAVVFSPPLRPSRTAACGLHMRPALHTASFSSFFFGKRMGAVHTSKVVQSVSPTRLPSYDARLSRNVRVRPPMQPVVVALSTCQTPVNPNFVTELLRPFRAVARPFRGGRVPRTRLQWAPSDTGAGACIRDWAVAPSIKPGHGDEYYLARQRCRRLAARLERHLVV